MQDWKKGVVWISIILALVFILFVIGYFLFTLSDLQLGKSDLGHFRYDAAIQRFEKILERQPHNPEAHLYLGLALSKRGDYDGAIAEFQWVKENYPHQEFPATVHSDIGMVYFAKRKYLEAIEELKKAILLDPSSAKAYFNLGTVYSAYGDIPEAVACFRTSLKIAPGDSSVHRNLALNLERMNDFEGAFKHWEKYLELTPAFYRNAEVGKHMSELKKKLGK
jgi:superkiller protein 3